ncbi:hypothetical protein MACK_002143 [Theileria orientalis]|uniref:ADP-ribosylation factor n=1 Tax=Theileria orientalis TaxID=68886 RepID=A0A976MDR7_THEOR|nr:hypothetical protein MACK_002143 [Theileria orientalis]
MGGVQSSCRKIANIVRANDPILNVRIAGLPGSGKTSIINYIKDGKTILSTEPELNSDPDYIIYDKSKLMIWTGELDIAKINTPYEEDGVNEEHSNAIIFVIDGTDEEKFLKVKEELRRELERSEFSPELLIMINKCDDPTCASLDELYTLLEVNKIIDRHVHVQHTSALTGEGVKEAMDWLCKRFEIRDGQYINRKDNSKISHLDRLYFKHNKRHKCLSDNTHCKQYSFQNPAEFKSLHTKSKDSLKHRSCEEEFDKREARSFHTLFAALKDVGEEGSLDPKPKVYRADRKMFKAKTPLKRLKGARKRYDKSGKYEDSIDPELENWTYKDKKTMGGKISEFEEMMEKINQLAGSKEKKDKDLYSFIKKGLKEASKDQNVVLKTHDIMKMIKNQEDLLESRNKKWQKYLKSIGVKPISKMESLEKYVQIQDLVEYNIEKKAKEDSCGFRYPIEGSPEEIYKDENEYKIWARTPLSQSQNAHSTREPMGELVKESKELEELIASTSRRYEKKVKEDLKELRESGFMKKISNMVKYESYNKGENENPLENQSEWNGSSNDLKVKEDYKYRNEQLENYYEFFKRSLLKADTESKDKMLRVLNRYNPWDEYVKMKNLKGSLPPMGVNYKVDMNKLRVSFRSSEDLGESEVSKFLMDYLHYFLILRSDELMFEEFRDAKFLYDILRYFDVDGQVPQEEKKEHLSLEDRFFKIYFPEECADGFPKREPDAEFPLSLERHKGLMGLSEKVTGRENNYHRVNMVSCLMALARSHALVGNYSADIFGEQRFKRMLETIETGLMLDLKSMDQGIEEIEVNNLNYKALCQVNGEYLATLTDILLEWNLRRGVENLLDLVLLLSLRKMEEMDAKSLVTIVRNVSYLTTLPESVYINFLGKVVDFVHERIKYGLVNKEEYMPLEVGLDLLKVLSRYPDVVKREFMYSFMHQYTDEIVNMGKRMEEDMKLWFDMVKGNHNEGDEYDQFENEDEKSGLIRGLRKGKMLSGSYSFDYLSKRKEYEHGWKSSNTYDEKKERMIAKIESRRLQIYGLISCLQLSGMTEYMYALSDLMEAFAIEDFELNSMAAISVLESFSEYGQFQKKVVMRAKNCLMKDKYQMDPERILLVLEKYMKGVRERRLEPDSSFFCTMVRRFASLRDPSPETLVEAARITDEYAHNLSKEQLFEIYGDLTGVPLHYNFLTRIGLSGELLEYPIYTIARVLYYASKNKAVAEKNWKTFYEIIYLFKHILTSKDINSILDGLIVANFTKADELLDILCKRVCNLIEISEINSDEVMEIMNKCLQLDYVPIQLLRFYTYSNMFELQNSELIQSLVDGPREYDVDFRGWKRPLSFDEHTEKVRLHHNVYADVKMRGSRPVLHESMNHPLQPTYAEPKHFEPVQRKHYEDSVLRSLANYFKRVQDLKYKLSESDRKLMDSLMSIVEARNISLYT